MTVGKIKKQKVQLICHKICRNCLEATELMNKINYLKENKITIDVIKENCKKFIKNNKSVLQIWQRFKSEKHNVFTEEINKIALSSNGYKKIQSIDLIETYVYGTSKDLEYNIKEIKCNSIEKQYKKWLPLIVF